MTDQSHPSSIKGNITAMVGKMQHNPQKQHDGNIMIANAAEQKAARFETKAAMWDSKGNASKAAKNREKAARYRTKASTKLAQPLTTPKTPVGAVGATGMGPGLKSDKAARCEAKALEYERKGNLAKAQRNREKAWRIREKHAIPHPIGAAHPSTQAGYTQHMTSVPTATGITGAHSYQGLNHPYTGAAAHPTYGYQRLAPNQKAERFEQKAAEYQRRGNLAKAQKNREKAQRYRARTQPGYQRPVRPANYYNDRASLFDRKAQQYQQWGMAPQAQRYQGRSQRIRAKHNIPLGAGAAPHGAHHGTTTPGGALFGATPGAHQGTYQGLNFPYAGAAAHPTYGYQRLAPNQKAERFEQKAAEYQRRGNMAKAQKNREKALRYRARTQPGYQRPVRPANYYTDRATLYDRKAQQYQQWGMMPQAQRYQGRSQRLRAKHNLPVTTTGTTYVGPLVPIGTVYKGTYQGLNFPYTGASAHPTYGYQRLAPNQKAERFEQKAAEYERRGNMAKAQKNREKAQRYRARTQPGYQRPVRPANYYNERANLFNQKAQQYQQWGMQPQATRYQQRAQRIRAKHSLPANTAQPVY